MPTFQGTPVQQERRVFPGQSVPPVAGSDPADREPGDLDVGVRPQSLEQLTGGIVSRPAATMIGGTVGAVVGAGVSGAPTAGAGSIPGALVGGALGTMAGEFTFDTAEQVARFFGAVEGELDPLETRVMRALRSGTEDVAFAGGFMAAGQALKGIRPLVGKALGLRTEEAQELARAAQSLGIGVGGVDVATGLRGRVLRGTARVLGIFPFIGSPFRAAGRSKAEDLIRKSDEILNSFAPNSVMSDDLGIDMVKAARNTQSEFRTTAANLYDNFRLLSRDLKQPNVVPTTSGALEEGAQRVGIKEATLGFVEEVKRKEIILRAGDGEASETLTGASADTLFDFIKKLGRLPETITVDQAQGLSDTLQQFVKQARSDGFDVKRVATIKSAIEEAFSDLRFADDTAEEARRVIDARDTANRFYSQNITKFQTPTAKKFERVDRNVFRAGPERPGSIDEDELGGIIAQLRGPKAIDDLVALVGRDNVKKAGRVFLDEQWERAVFRDADGVPTKVNFEEFGKRIGFLSKNSAARTKAAKLFNLAGVNQKQFLDFIRVARKIEVPKDVNTFIARRAALGGLGAAIGGATAPSILSGSVLTSFGMAILIRRGTKIISDPKLLKQYTEFFAPNTKELRRRQLLGRFIEGLQREEEQDTLASP